MSPGFRRFVLMAGLFLAVIITTGTVLAQDTPTCPQQASTGCAVISLSPSGLTGDFYLGDTRIAEQVNPAAVPIPAGTSQRIDIRNIRSAEQGYGTLFVYDDTFITANVGDGKTQFITTYPRKRYIRGTLNVLCDVRGRTIENVACSVSIDDIAQPDVLAPGALGSYVLEPGTHKVLVMLVGDQSLLWDPASREQSANITAGGTRQVSTRFDKKALAMLVLDQQNVLADFYMDGQLLAAQAASYQLYVAPGKTHRFEARNITDPAAGDVYRWKDAAASLNLAPGSARTVTLRLQKQYLKGFLNLTCTVANPPQGESLTCQPVIDGNIVEPIPAGGSQTYTLDPGSHRVDVTLTPEGDWSADPVSIQVNVPAGQTVKRTASFRIKAPATPTPTAVPPGVTVAHGVINSTVWRGEVHVIGDVRAQNLTIMPGTIIRVAANSDIHDLNTYPPDEQQGIIESGENCCPGERYPDEDHHISIWIQDLNAVGTPTQPIIITSDSPTPQAGDWNRFNFERGTLSYAQVSYYVQLEGRSGVISNNVLGYSAAQAVGTFPGGNPTIENNIVSYAFHELAYIDGPAIVRNNQFGPNPRDYGLGYGGICIAINSPNLPTIVGNIIHDCDHGVRLVHGVNPALDLNAILNSNVFLGNNQNIVNEAP